MYHLYKILDPDIKRLSYVIHKRIFYIFADADECLDSTCEQTCENSIGGFQCTCWDGYVVSSSNDTLCDGQFHILYFTSYHIILSLYTSSLYCLLSMSTISLNHDEVIPTNKAAYGGR